MTQVESWDEGENEVDMAKGDNRSVLLREADVEVLQDLVLSAVNLALGQARQRASERLGPLAGGLPF